MKRFLSLLLALLMIFLLCGCSDVTESEDSSSQLQVVCTLFPYYDFVRQIGGDYVNPTLLVSAGKESHSFEPTPLDVITISKADVFICNGGESESWVEDILSAAGENIGTVLHMMDAVNLEQEEYVEGMEKSNEDSDVISYDEHIWTSPVIAMDLCRVICDAFCAEDPAHELQYRQNLEQYLQKLTELDQAFSDVVSHASRTQLIFGDRFPLLYFCRTYGLSYRAAFHGCASDTEPSLTTLKYLIDRVNDDRIPVVYTIELSSQKVASAIAEATGAKVLTFYSCQSISRQDFANGETYISLMWRNVENLKEGLL